MSNPRRPGEILPLGVRNRFAGTACTCDVHQAFAGGEYFLQVMFGCPIHCPAEPEPILMQVSTGGSSVVVLSGYDRWSARPYQVEAHEKKDREVAAILEHNDNVFRLVEELAPLFRERILAELAGE